MFDILVDYSVPLAIHYTYIYLVAAAASPTGAEEDLWSDFVQSGQSEVCADLSVFIALFPV